MLCSCSTPGPIAEAARVRHGNIVRIDHPLMRAAASHVGVVLVALWLDSTLAPTIALLQLAFAHADKVGEHEVVLCRAAWPHFERGDIAAFAAAIAAEVKTVAARKPRLGCVVLAQASMAAAEFLLQDLGVPIYSSPRLAVAETLRAAQGA